MSPTISQLTKVQAGRTSDRLRHLLPQKAIAGVFGFLLLGAILAPIAQNWRANPQDSVPFSYYPMFSAKRGDAYVVSYIVGLDAQGNRHPISYKFAGDGGFNQTRRQINRLIHERKADTLCQAVATKLALAAAPYGEITTVGIVTGEFRFADYFAGQKAPLSERVHASCQVARRGHGKEVEQ